MSIPAQHLVTWLTEIFADNPSIANAVRESVDENPQRIDNAYRELLSGYTESPEQILKVTLHVPEGEQAGWVHSDDVPFLSFCAHHFLPFFGTVDLSYRPGPNILGIGKIPRLIACRSRRFQLQELLVKELAEDMVGVGLARGVRVIATARHLCVCYRGPNMPSVTNRTSYTLGDLQGL